MNNRFQVEEDILVYAFRYALGRQTFAPSIVCDNILNNKNLFHAYTVSLMIKEIDEAIECNRISEIDKPTWNSLKYELLKVLDAKELGQ